MKYIFVGINAKYIHTNPAIRILNKIVESNYDSTFKEFTIKDTEENIIDNIINYDVILFSCYIWNIEIIKNLSQQIKQKCPNKIICAGGPEVSYEPGAFINCFDYIMCGEGETIIEPLFRHLEYNEKLPNGIATKSILYAIPVFTDDLSLVPDILDDYNEDDRKNRIIYVETNRGCPFNCSYCLSSLEDGIRFFPEDYQNRLFDYICGHKFKCIKFLDRSFNINPHRFINICKRLENSDNTFQFEVEPNLFNYDVIEYFTREAPKGKFRLEVGIQSLNEKTIKSVCRNQKSTEIIDTISKINTAGRCTIHCDLIAGLPYEDLECFKSTFNRTFALRCEELQLGFLKMLRGTKIRREYLMFDYKFDSLPPYEVISNQFLNKDEMDIIHHCENALEWMWNDKRCLMLIDDLFKIENFDFFDFFYNIDLLICNDKKIEDKYRHVLTYLDKIHILNNDYIDNLKYDYLFVNRIKPIPFWIDSSSSIKNPFDYKKIGLDETYKNSFITTFKGRYLVIKYKKDCKPLVEII